MKWFVFAFVCWCAALMIASSCDHRARMEKLKLCLEYTKDFTKCESYK